jgi:hypothetical protein
VRDDEFTARIKVVGGPLDGLTDRIIMQGQTDRMPWIYRYNADASVDYHIRWHPSGGVALVHPSYIKEFERLHGERKR